MPTFVRSKSGDNYRVKGESVTLAWRVKRFLGLLIRFTEDPSGNALYVAGNHISHLAVLSQESVDAAAKAMADAQAHQGGDGKKIIETPSMMIPRKRAH